MALTSDYDISLIDDGSYYVFNQLYKTITRDENDAITQEYKDKEGRIVMKRTYGSSSNSSGVASDSWHETYYVYDIYGNLTYVIPPLVTNASPLLAQAEICTTASASVTLVPTKQFKHKATTLKRCSFF